MRELLNGHYITHRKNLLITGPTGCGKSWIANALGEQACRQKHSVRYCRTGRLLEQLAQGRVDGSWLKYLKQLQKIRKRKLTAVCSHQTRIGNLDAHLI